MENLIQQTKKLNHDIQNGLTYLETARSAEVESVERKLHGQIDMVFGNCDRLDILVRKEPPNRREQAKLTVDQLKYDCNHLKSAMDNMLRRRREREEAEYNREQLLSTSFKPNSGDTSILIDSALQHNSSLGNAHRGIDDLLGSGHTILDSLRGQRSTLKSAHKKVLDVMNTLGLSNTVMRLIERRTYQDKFILYGGMIFTCIVMFLAVKYFLY